MYIDYFCINFRKERNEAITLFFGFPADKLAFCPEKRGLEQCGISKNAG